MDRVFRAKDSSSTKMTPGKNIQVALTNNLQQPLTILAGQRHMFFFSKDCFLEKWEELQVTWSAVML